MSRSTMVVETEVLLASSICVFDNTSMASMIGLTSKRNDNSAFCPTLRTISLVRAGRKPLASTYTEYRPGLKPKKL